MEFKCQNSNCSYEANIQNPKFVLDNDGNVKRDDTLCPHCGDKMRNNESSDFKGAKIKKPTPNKTKKFYERKKKYKVKD